MEKTRKSRKLSFSVNKEKKTVEVVDKSGYLIERVSYNTSKELDKLKRRFKSNMSFNENVHRIRADSGMYKDQPPVYEAKIYRDPEKETREEFEKRFKSNKGSMKKFQYYITGRINIQGEVSTVHGRSNLHSDIHDIYIARREAEENFLKLIDYEVNFWITQKGDTLQDPDRGSSATIGAEIYMDLVENSQIERYEGVLWYEGQKRKSKKVTTNS